MSNLTIETVPIAGQEEVPPLCQYSDEELEVFKVDELQSKVQVQEERLGEQRPNLQAIQVPTN